MLDEKDELIECLYDEVDEHLNYAAEMEKRCSELEDQLDKEKE